MSTIADHTEFARTTAEARRDILPLSAPQGLGGAPFADAYAAQDAYVLAVDMPVAGYKLAVNGAAQQAHFGVDKPAGARIFLPEVYQSGTTLTRADYDSIYVEPEICAVLGSAVLELDSPVDREGALALVEVFRPAIELIDQRGNMMPRLELGQAIALNVFNAGIVLGEGGCAPDALDVAGMQVTMDLDGTRAGEATGAAPQDPGEAVQWMVNHALERGLELRPGMVIMCGTHLPLKELPEGTRTVAIAMGGLGEVSFTIEG